VMGRSAQGQYTTVSDLEQKTKIFMSLEPHSQIADSEENSGLKGFPKCPLSGIFAFPKNES